MQEQATKLRDDTSGTALPEPPHVPVTPTASPGWEKPARYLTAIFLILGVIVAFGLFLPVLKIVLLAFIFAIVIDIPARFLARYTPLSYRIGTALVYLLIVAVVVLLIVLLAPHLIAGFEQVRAAIEARRASDAEPLVSLSDFSQVVIRALIAAVRGLVTSISIVGTAVLLGFMLQLDLFNA